MVTTLASLIRDSFLRQKFMGKKEYNREKNKDYREKGIRYVKTWQKAKDNRNN